MGIVSCHRSSLFRCRIRLSSRFCSSAIIIRSLPRVDYFVASIRLLIDFGYVSGNFMLFNSIRNYVAVRIILRQLKGIGVMAQQHMLDRVREKFTVLLNGYLPVPDVRDYIVTPAVAGNGSATLGNFVLAKEISERHVK